MQLPHFEVYCNNTTGENALVFSFGSVDVYFSYRTPVAFRANGRLVVHQNDWGKTTGKHLNAIDGGDKKSRVDSATFKKHWQEILAE